MNVISTKIGVLSSIRSEMIFIYLYLFLIFRSIDAGNLFEAIQSSRHIENNLEPKNSRQAVHQNIQHSTGIEDLTIKGTKNNHYQKKKNNITVPNRTIHLQKRSATFGQFYKSFHHNRHAYRHKQIHNVQRLRTRYGYWNVVISRRPVDSLASSLIGR